MEYARLTSIEDPHRLRFHSRSSDVWSPVNRGRAAERSARIGTPQLHMLE